MDGAGPRRAPLSRETRLLLVTIVVSMTTLWGLARVRFADRPTPNPIAPVLTQLAPPPIFDQLASAMLQVQSRLAPLMLGIDVRRLDDHGGEPAGRAPHEETVAALRLDAGTAVALLGGHAIADHVDPGPGMTVAADDPASGLAVIRLPNDGASLDPFVPPPTWSPRQPQATRYLVAAEISSGGVSARPVVVGALEPLSSQIWSDLVWALPEGTDLGPGTFVFTPEGALAGLTAQVGDRLALVQGDTVRNTADRLRREGPKQYGRLGIEVQPLSPGLAKSTRIYSGVIVSWVDPEGPAAGHVRTTDVITAVAGQPLSSLEQWYAVSSRILVGQPIELRLQRGDEVVTASLTAEAASTATESLQLGLTMRGAAPAGVEVLDVSPGSAAALAGIRAGDLITVIGSRQSPTPAEVRRIYAAASSDRPLLVAVTRGSAHLVLTLQNR